MQTNRRLFFYFIKFLGLFGLLFYGTEAIIGLSSPDGLYNPFVAKYLNFIDPFRQFLLLAAGAFVSLFGYRTHLSDAFTLSLDGGSGVRMVYSCIGYGVISFWIAFVFANSGTWKKKAAWMLGGALALCTINILRIGLLLIATNKGWPIPLGWDHHTWFNIVAYALIFAMIFFFDKAGKKRVQTKKEREVELDTFPSINV